jgi:CubicO group peptidase (beta-lactamase class C family)
MRLAQLNGTGVTNLKIKDYVPEYTQGGVWTSTTFGHMIDMASGNYNLAGFESDEGALSMSNFFLAEDYSSKIGYAFQYPNKAAAGTKWIYHSSDTFILSRAMNNYYGSDIFNMVRDQVYTPIKLSAGAKTTIRTDNSVSGVPFGGYGLFWTQDDLAKIAKLLNNDNGAANGTQLLSPSLLAEGMHQTSNHGFDTSIGYMYKDSFWAYNFTTADNASYYGCAPWVPYMSGYGGITVAMAPNGATYYITGDKEEFIWKDQITETNKLSPMCP